jgi:transcriptional regulator with XRE-family HTH domain
MTRPHAETRLAKFVAQRVLELRPLKSQIEIATEAGYPNPNMISMIRNGSTMLALDRVPAMSKALDCDPRRLFMLTLEQRWGSTTSNVIEEIFGTIVSQNEVVWIEELRDASKHTDPTLTTRYRTALRTMFPR